MILLLSGAFSLVFAASWRVGLLIALLLALRRLVRGRIPEQVLFFGWIVVAVRLLIPFGVPTAWSPFNLAKPIPLPVAESAVHSSVSSLGRGAENRPSTVADQTRAASALSVTQTLALIWAAGVLALAAARAGSAWAFRRRLRVAVSVADRRTETMVQRCLDELGAADAIPVIATDAVNAPALYGIVRPRLLFPIGFAARLSDDELRLVVLHELGHWRRRDLLVQSLLYTGRMLHWFNPLVCLAVRQARTDCELACDEFVLRRQSPTASCDYGVALLKVLGAIPATAPVPMALGVLEDRKQIKERIRRIAAYRVATAGRLAIGGGLLAAIALLSATHETWAQDTVKSVVAAITKAAPEGWRRIPYGNESVFEVGMDPAQPFRGYATTGYVRALAAGEKLDFSGFAQACLADDYRGQRVRFSAWMKTEDVRGAAGIWLRVDGEKRHGLQFDNMSNRPVRGTTAWTQYSVVLDVPAEAVSLNYGFSVTEGTGQAWFSKPRLEVVGPEVASTNTVQARPGVCSNPNCASSLTGKHHLYRTIANSSFAATTAK
jgi:beta-lactamase regulating signal transducer with metallopeptidase domain